MRFSIFPDAHCSIITIPFSLILSNHGIYKKRFRLFPHSNIYQQDRSDSVITKLIYAERLQVKNFEFGILVKVALFKARNFFFWEKYDILIYGSCFESFMWIDRYKTDAIFELFQRAKPTKSQIFRKYSFFCHSIKYNSVFVFDHDLSSLDGDCSKFGWYSELRLGPGNYVNGNNSSIYELVEKKK